MIAEFNRLSNEEILTLKKAPSLISVYAAIIDDSIMPMEGEKALQIAYANAQTSPLPLKKYYEEVSKDFLSFYGEILDELPNRTELQLPSLKNRLEELNNVISKLDDQFAKLLRKSLHEFATQISETNQGLLSSFIFPLKIKGITESNLEIF